MMNTTLLVESLLGCARGVGEVGIHQCRAVRTLCPHFSTGSSGLGAESVGFATLQNAIRWPEARPLLPLPARPDRLHAALKLEFPSDPLPMLCKLIGRVDSKADTSDLLAADSTVLDLLASRKQELQGDAERSAFGNEARL